MTALKAALLTILLVLILAIGASSVSGLLLGLPEGIHL